MNLLFFTVFLCAGIVFSIAAKKLTVIAALTGAGLAALLFAGFGWTGIFLMATFFLAGTLATSWRRNVKEGLGLAQENKGRRNAGQVLANAGAGGILGILALVFPQASALFLLLTAGAFSSAAADTVSSELGSVYGRKFYDVLGLKSGRRGDDGVISLAGILAGIAGSVLIAAVYAAGTSWNASVIWIIVAGTVGNFTDSILGAVWERKKVIGNDAVNFLNTLAGALTTLLFHQL